MSEPKTVIESELHPLIEQFRRTQLEVLESAYAIVAAELSKPILELKKNQKAAAKLFQDFCRLCFRDMNANVRLYGGTYGPSVASLSRWMSGLSSPEFYNLGIRSKEIYEFTKQQLTAG